MCFVRPMGKDRLEKMVSEHALSSNALLTIVVGNVRDDAEVHFEAEWIMHKARGRAIRNMHAQYSFVTHKKAGGTARLDEVQSDFLHGRHDAKPSCMHAHRCPNMPNILSTPSSVHLAFPTRRTCALVPPPRSRFLPGSASDGIASSTFGHGTFT